MNNMNQIGFPYIGTKNWSFSQKDQHADKIFEQILIKTRKQLPVQIYSPYVLTYLQKMKETELYQLMRTIPKGVLHHCHLDCNQDEQFYSKYIVTEKNIYLNKDKSSFKIGNQQQAMKEGWISFEQLRKQYNSQTDFIKQISNMTMFNQQNNRQVAAKEINVWHLFQKNILTFFTILFSLKHFKLYMKHVCLKYIQNGYDRLEFRSMLSELNEYDEKGNFIKKHPQSKFIEIIDQVCEEIVKDYPNFTLGVIFFGLKMFNDQQNQQIFTKVCQLNWDKTIGFDFVQEEDAYGSLQSYDKVVDKVLKKYPHLNYKKVYHAGQTKNVENNNLQIAIDNGSVRIGHGVSIMQRIQLLKKCKNICFEVNHISNILSGLRSDTRISSIPILLSLGYVVTINPDDPGKFGYQDSTVDYFSSIISFNWSLKDLKLVGIHSINHAICSEQQKQKLLNSFNNRWDSWIKKFLQKHSLK